jgi:Holliday junction DNA helicase RuvA
MSLKRPCRRSTTFRQTGKEVILLTHYAVKEDSVALYGFLHEAERTLFRNLQKVSGIGAKIALAVLSGVSTEDFARLVQAGDVVALDQDSRHRQENRRAHRGRIARSRGWAWNQPAGACLGIQCPLDAAGEATVALQQLGYKPAEVTRLVQKVAAEGDSAEAIIRKALRAALGS